MPRYPKKSKSFSTQRTFPCPVQGCRTQIRSQWGFTQHIRANHSGMDLQYPGNEDGLVQFPSSDIDETSSPPPSRNPFSQDEPNIHFQVSDCGPSDFNLNGNTVDLVNEPSVPADSTEFHPFINGMCINYIILQRLMINYRCAMY
jgi:hypothetical protein